MEDIKGEVVGKSRRPIVFEKGLAESLGFPFGDHAAPTRRDRHGAGATEDLQLHGSALHARDAQRHAPIVYLVVGVVLYNDVI